MNRWVRSGPFRLRLWIAFSFAWILFLLVRTAQAGAGFGPNHMPGIGLRASDAIDHFDFTVDGDRSIDVAFLVTQRPNEFSATTQAWFRRLDLPRASWSDPTPITPTASPPIRIISSQGHLHVFMGRRLQHFVSADGGSTWSELPPITPERWVLSFDAIPDLNSIQLAYMAFIPKRSSHNPDSLSVETTRWSDHGLGTPAVLGVFEGVSPPEPKLLIRGKAVHLFYAVNRVNGGDVPDRVDATLYHTSHTDQPGWSRSEAISTLGRSGGVWRSEGSGYISHIDAVNLGDSVYAFYNAAWLYVTRSGNEGAWSRVAPVVCGRTWFGPSANSSVAAAAIAGRGQLLWIDERYQHTDRTPWNPWGFPWFLTADWANNDVLALPLTSVPRAIGTPIESKPERLTRDLSFAAEVRARAGNSRIYALWPGREKVGKLPASSGTPPTIFFLSLPPK